MLENFGFAFDAVMPMLLLMLLGYWLRQKQFFDDALVRRMNSFVFSYAIPFLMFSNVYVLDSLSDISPRFLAVVMASITIITVLCWLAAQLLTKEHSQKGVIMQVGFRSNFAIIGAIMAAALGGAEGSRYAAGLQAPGIIFFNVMAVICLTVYSDDPNRSVDVRGIVNGILTNRLIMGLFAGVCCLCLREFIPRNAAGELIFSLQGSLPFLYSTVTSLSKMASPLAMIMLGAQVNFHPAPGLRGKIVAGTAMRLVIVPAVGFALAFAAQALGVLELTPAVVSALLAFYGSPMAAVGAVMAAEMGCDGELARQYAVWTAALSMLTLFLWILLFRFAGLL